MGVHRPPILEVNSVQLRELTGFSPRTIRLRLAESGLQPARVEARTTWWNPQEALRVIYDVPVAAADALDLTAERAALAKSQREMQLLKNAEHRGALLPAASVSWFMSVTAASWKSRLRGIATKARATLGFSASQAHAILALIDDTLRELGDDTELPDEAGDVLQRDWERALAAADSESGVG